jgi:alkanesulfonate monooxygenase SsuD/methylene tetrahydromethanopterin reductase-like flavin-dependent oxidoreductase (luciferase family)
MRAGRGADLQIGMNLPVMVPGLGRDAVFEWSRRIDAGPFSSLAAGERITFPNPEIMVTLSAAAAVTERVRITFSVLVLPMHNPVRIAKQVATLDVLSGGRVSLGLGVGGREEDYVAVGAEYDRGLWKRLEEEVATMRRAWAGELVVEGALRPVEPAPLQPGGPELLAGSMYPRSIRRAARWADGISGFSFGPAPEEVKGQFELARSAWKEEGRASAPRLVSSFWFALGDDARGQLDGYLLRYLNFLGREAARKLAPTVTTTSPRALRDAARMAEDLGCDELILVPTTSDPDEVDRVADILG